MISGAVLPMQSFPGDVCGLRVSQLVCFDQWLRLSSCLCVCSVFNWTMCAITKHFKDPLLHLDRILIKSDVHVHPNHPPRSSTLIRYVMCFSLILLSVDLSSPHVKNKMSKREFIRNTRGAVGAEGDKSLFVGYQKVFLCSGSRTGGRPLRKPLRQHFPARPYRLVFAINLESKKIKNQLLAADEERPVDQDKQQFVPGYLALFL